MKITFLGTGTSGGVPMIACKCDVCRSKDPKDNRLRCSILIEYENNVALLIDIGPDFRQQMLYNDVTNLDAVLITHCHRDHTAGLDDIRALNFHLKKEIDLYMDHYTKKEIKSQFSYIFTPNPYPGLPKVNVKLFNHSAFTVQGVEVVPIKTLHHKMTVWGFRFGNFTYITDANYIDANELEKVKGSEVFVINALRKEKHLSHYTLDEALDIIDQIQPKKAYLTHLSHQMGLHESVSKELPDHVDLAYDGLQIEL